MEEAPEEDEVEDEDVLEESEEHEAPTTTTEAAKKLAKSGGVRPFRYSFNRIHRVGTLYRVSLRTVTKVCEYNSRSNEDLLAALKRRRAQTGPSNHPARETAATHAAVEHTTAKSK